MQGKHNISSLFDRSGNLTPDAMQWYLEDQLGPGERELVEKHLAESAFDREALEGFKNRTSAEFSQDLTELKQGIMALAKKKAKTGRVMHSDRMYWYAAAGFAAIIGLSVILFFMFRGPADKPQLAAISPDTIIPEKVMESEHTDVNPVIDTEFIPEELPVTKQIIKEEAVSEVARERTEIVPVPIQPIAANEPLASAKLTDVDDDVVAMDVVADDVIADDLIADENIVLEKQIVGGISLSDNQAGNERKLPGNGGRAASNYGVQAESAIMDAEYNGPVYQADTMIFSVVETMPEFPGGEEALSRYLYDHVKYPEAASESGVQGKVFVSFVVNADSTISDVRVLRGIGAGCDEEAVRVVESMPKWKPGRQRGIPVRVSYVLPIKFSLE